MESGDDFGAHLSAIAKKILERCRTTREGLRGDRQNLRELLVQCGCEPHESSMSFEQRYGGLQVYESEAEIPALEVGPYACLKAGFSIYPRAGTALAEQHLVPVIASWDDAIFYLGADGRGWLEWTDGRMSAIANDGEQLLTRALLWRTLIASGANFDDGAFGDTLAAERGLAPIDEAYGGEQWWGSPDSVIVQFDHPTMGECTYYTAEDR